eukprot:jgi/Tetstr1/459812/TSEL_005162.t1
MPAGRGRATAGGLRPACHPRCRLLNLLNPHATQLAIAVSVADALTITKVLRWTAEGEELRAAAAQHLETVDELRSRLSAAEITAEQSKQEARYAKSKLYHHRYNVRKRKHGADEEDSADGSPVSKDSIDAYIRPRRDELEQCLTTMLSAKWEEYYKNDGAGETLSALPPHAANSSGEEAASDIGDTACNRSPADNEHRSFTHMPRWVLRSLFDKYRHLLYSLLDDMGHNRRVETAAKAVMERHGREDAMKIYTDSSITARS